MSEALERLRASELVGSQREGTGRWHGAVARAATELLSRGQDLEDLRVPVAWALLEIYGDSISDDALVELVGVMTPLTAVAPARRTGPNGRAEDRTEG